MRKRLFLVFAVLSLILTYIHNPQLARSAELANSNSLTATVQENAALDRCISAVAYSQGGWAKSNYAVLASAESFADALCSVALAQKLAAPLLLTTQAELTEVTAQELQRLKVKHVVIIGGPQALAANIENELKESGIESSERLFGQDRYATSLAVAQKLNPANGVVLAAGTDCSELLPISAIAGYTGMPVIFIDKNNLTDELKNYFQENLVQTGYLVGELGEISSEIAELFANPISLMGRDSFEVNALVLNEFERLLDFSRIYAVKTDKDSQNSELVEWEIASQAAHFGYPVILTNGSIPSVLLDCLKTKVLTTSEIISIGCSVDEATKIISQFNQLLPSSAAYAYSAPGKKNKSPAERPQPPEPTDPGESEGPEEPREPTEPEEPGEPGEPIKPAPVEVLEVTSITDNGYYKAGDLLELSLTFSGDVEVTGEPVLKLATGANPGAAVYSSGSGSPTLIFNYTVQPGDNSDDLNYLAADALDLNGGTILSSDTGVAVDLTLPEPGRPGSLSYNRDIIIDTIAPSALYISNQNVIHPECSLTLTVEGGPLSPESWEAIFQIIKDNTGAGENWLSGVSAGYLTLTIAEDGTSALLKNTNLSKKALIIEDFVFPNSIIIDKAGNHATQDLTVDSYKEGSVVAVYSLYDRSDPYKIGKEIWIGVEFNVHQLLLNNPNKITLSLATGQDGRVAVCQNLTGINSNILQFKYMPQFGDLTSDLDYTGSNALQLNGAKIEIYKGNTPVDLLLPEPGEPGSLGHVNNIAIDTFPPTAILISQQNLIPAKGSVTLTAVDGPLATMSWYEIFEIIKSNTSSGGNWISGINPSDLEMIIGEGHISVETRNNSSQDAIINSDFVIPSGRVYDLAGNKAEEDIIIDAYADPE
ncbi:MAG: hypothetical protein GX351_05295 [Peptococcaceae bacterium]|nr:hypothetical protein [Peptococcaceae bacterium]